MLRRTILLSSILVASTDAFVPLHHPPTAQSMMQLRAQGNPVDRFFRVVRSNVNKLVSSMEDPEKVITQAVSDMQNDLVRIRQAYAESTATKRRLERKKEQLETNAEDWHQRARLALDRGDKEYLAKEALSRRQLLLDEASSIQSQIDTLATDKLYTAMMALEGKIREAYGKKEQLVARAKTAKNTAAVNDMLSGLTGKTSMDTFIRMEEKVESLEAAAEASAELSLLGSSDGKTPSLEAEFLMLEQSSNIDDELAKLKRELNLIERSSTTPKRSEEKVFMKEFERVYLN